MSAESLADLRAAAKRFAGGFIDLPALREALSFHDAAPEDPPTQDVADDSTPAQEPTEASETAEATQETADASTTPEPPAAA